MPGASYAQSSFLGGEWSPDAQGRFDDPAYEKAMNVCFNGYPTENGSWTRRSGTQYAGTTRNGAPGRVIAFDYSGSAPLIMEFTDGHLRLRNGPSLLRGSDSVSVTSISSATPALVSLSGPVVCVG